MTARAAHSDTGELKATQLQLVDVPAVPSLTPRQQRALELVQAAGSSGIHADELGALLHEEYGKHGRDQRCQWDGSVGNSLLKRLRQDGLVKYRRGSGGIAGYWQATEGRVETHPPGMLRDDQDLPF